MDQEQVRMAAEARGYRLERMTDGNWRLIGADGRVAVADWTMDRGWTMTLEDASAWLAGQAPADAEPPE